jgi:hypothetical protein
MSQVHPAPESSAQTATLNPDKFVTNSKQDTNRQLRLFYIYCVDMFQGE